MEKKVLTLSVSKQWFDMIKSGEKTEEYREIKEYWIVRLFDLSPFYTGAGAMLFFVDGKRMTFKELVSSATSSTVIRVTNLNGEPLNDGVSVNEILDSLRLHTHVLFINGYGDDKPRVEKEIESISIGKPKKGWCPDEFLDKEYFVIKLKESMNCYKCKHFVLDREEMHRKIIFDEAYVLPCRKCELETCVFDI